MHMLKISPVILFSSSANTVASEKEIWVGGMIARSSPDFSYHLHKFKDLAQIRGFQTHFILFCFSRGTICKMKVYVRSLYKQGMRSC